ncbi:MAG TPA: DUF4136 domain-containing protein [Vicinamibacterales bacterium]|nr:DUF4136 domain-containing protein [Vicinamibacterales bacterium]
MVRAHRVIGCAAWTLTFLAVTSAAAAQKFEIKTNQDPKASFASIKTYAWLPPAPLVKNVAPGGLTNPTLSEEALGPHIVAAIDRELAARGWSKVADVDKADVKVAYFAALTTGFNNTYLGEYYGYVTGWANPIAPGYTPSTSMSVYEKGTVIVDIVQRAENRAIWRGSVQTRINQEHTLQQRIERINKGAERMFEKFPVKAAKTR